MRRTILRSFLTELVLLLAVLAFGVVGFVLPVLREQGKMQSKLRSVQERLDSGREHLGELTSLTSELQTLKGDIQALEGRLTSTISLTSLSRELRGAARERRLFLVQDGTWTDGTLGSGYREHRKELAVVGSLAGIVSFLEYVETREYFLGFDSVALRRTNGTDVVARFELRFRKAIRTTQPSPPALEDQV